MGAVVGVLSIVLREFFALLLPGRSAFLYAISVAFAYAVAIAASYLGHRWYTFRHTPPVASTAGSLARFSAIALLGLATTTGVSVVLRSAVFSFAVFGHLADALSFGAAGLLVSVGSYLLNATFTFPKARTSSSKHSATSPLTSTSSNEDQ